MSAIFQNRVEAGQHLSTLLLSYYQQPNTQVLALPRGGVPVAYEIASALKLPLDVFIVRKLGVPGHEEYAFGALAEGDVQVLNKEVMQTVHILPESIQAVLAKEAMELRRRQTAYRPTNTQLIIKNQHIILVDDGIATGASIKAAILALKTMHPAKITLAIPVAPVSTLETLSFEVDEIICPYTPEPFYSVGSWYEDFPQTTDEEVITLLHTKQTTKQTI